MSDFPASGAADHSTLTDRVGREVVVEHEPFFVFLDRTVDPLGVAGGAQGDRADRLGFAAGEDRGTVNAGQQVDRAVDVPQVSHATAVQPCLVVEDQVADHELFEIVEGFLEVAAGCPIGGFLGVLGEVLLEQFVLQGLGLFVPFGFHVALHRGLQSVEAVALQCTQKRVLAHTLVLGLLDAQFGDQLVLQFADRDDVLLGKEDGLEHLVLGHLLGKALDHQHALEVAGDDQVETAFGGLFESGEDDQLVIDLADPDGRQRSLEGNGFRNHQCGTGTNDGVDVGVVFGIDREHVGHDLDLVLVPLGEHGTDRAIGQPRGEDLPGRGPTLPLQKSAGKLARGCEAFTVVDRQREKVNATSWGSVL